MYVELPRQAHAKLMRRARVQYAWRNTLLVLPELEVVDAGQYGSTNRRMVNVMRVVGGRLCEHYELQPCPGDALQGMVVVLVHIVQGALA